MAIRGSDRGHDRAVVGEDHGDVNGSRGHVDAPAACAPGVATAEVVGDTAIGLIDGLPQSRASHTASGRIARLRVRWAAWGLNVGMRGSVVVDQ